MRHSQDMTSHRADVYRHVFQDHHGVVWLQAGSTKLHDVAIKAHAPQEFDFLQTQCHSPVTIVAIEPAFFGRYS